MTATDAMARNELQVGASGGGGGKFSLGVARASHCRLYSTEHQLRYIHKLNDVMILTV